MAWQAKHPALLHGKKKKKKERKKKDTQVF